MDVYNRFCEKYTRINRELGKEQYIVPYLMSSHPGSTMKDAVKLAEYLRDHHMNPEQVQDFYPTPGSLSTCMYYTGIDPRTMQNVYVPRKYEEKQMQRALLQYKRPENHSLVYSALKQAGRLDLVGSGEKCLIKDNKRGAEKNGKNIERKGSFRKGKGRYKGSGREADKSRNKTGSGGRNRRK